MLKKIRNLQPGDKVDLCSFPAYDSNISLYEYGVVEEVQVETPTCFAVYFENACGVAMSPDFAVEVED